MAKRFNKGTLIYDKKYNTPGYVLKSIEIVKSGKTEYEDTFEEMTLDEAAQAIEHFANRNYELKEYIKMNKNKAKMMERYINRKIHR